MITNFIRIIKCLFGRHEYIPVLLLRILPQKDKYKRL